MFGWTDTLKLLAVTVTAGVVTAIAIQFTTGYLEAKAKTAAKAEMEQILLLAAQQQQPQTVHSPTAPAVLPVVSGPRFMENGKQYIPDSSGIGYVNVIP